MQRAQLVAIVSDLTSLRTGVLKYGNEYVITGLNTLAIDDLAQEFTSTARFGTSMSACRILGLKAVPRVGLFAH